MTTDTIIADLLKKIDSLNETITNQNAFIMKMATYRDEREDKLSKSHDDRLGELFALIRETGAVEQLFKWIYDGGQRPDIQAGQPADEEHEDLDS